MEAAGLWMLPAVAIVLLGTGLPAFAVLMGVSVLFAALGLAGGGLELAVLTALPSRVIGLLENDLLQALPLYVFMGALLNRLPLADRPFQRSASARHAGPGRPARADEWLGGRRRRHALAQRGAQACRARPAGGREHGAGLRRQHPWRGDPAVAGPDPAGRRHVARPYRGPQRYPANGAHRQHPGH